MSKAIFEQGGPTYVDEHVRVLAGTEAERLLREKNDRSWFDPTRGVAQVSRERWDEAQRYEHTTWFGPGRSAVDDRNTKHRRRFVNYEFLRDLTFERAIELGCGPFTNVRYILEVAKIAELELLDPLAAEYMKHPFCRYAGGRMGGVLHFDASQARALKRPLQMLDERRNRFKIGGLWGRPVTVHSSSIEQFSPTRKYDLVVMVNVLEHCQDADTVLNRIDAMLKPGGMLVYADKIYRASEVDRGLERHYDAGHPLRVDQSIIDAFLDAKFSSKMHAVYARKPKLAGDAESELYYMGVRKS